MFIIIAQYLSLCKSRCTVLNPTLTVFAVFRKALSWSQSGIVSMKKRQDMRIANWLLIIEE